MWGFQKIMKGSCVALAGLTAISIMLYCLHGGDICETLAITFGTTLYHIAMRLIVGGVVDKIMNNRADYTAPWFNMKPFEHSLYKALGVKNWKGRMPSYDPDLFDIKKHSLEEIIMATCQAEVVHEICAALSFLPLLGVRWLGSLYTFVITSTLAACVDMVFVIMQRYNRPRLAKLAKLKAY